MPNQNVNINFTATANFSSVLGSVNQVKNALNGIKLPPDLTSKIKNSMSDLENSTKKVQTILSKGIHTKADSNALHKAIQEMDRDSERLQKDINKINNTHIKMNVEGSEKVKDLQKRIEEARKGFEQFKNYGSSKSTGNLISAAAVSNVEKDIAGANKLKSMYASLKSSFKAGDSQQAISQIDSILNHLRKVGTMMDNTANNPGRGTRLAAYFEQLKAAALDASGGVDKLEKELKEFVQAETAAQKGNLKNLASGMRANYMDTARGLQQSTKEAERFTSQMGMLQSSADYFFGLQNMFYLMRSGIRDTLETVKELDKAMTETAVVTDRTVGDLWKQLPDYTDLANKLGATTKGAYETMTLYYQQGLEKDQTFEIGEETMKMARIAGLDYAETTNMMTAALRGFNMELNQDSAKKVNDVYSKLAAITASDTKEIGSAMERTASIAHSANMDFETTSAFLAQMIETTREAPENLGTAMKTIIARFQELKENPMEIGEVEGEEVSFNRVDKALKTIGVQLVDSKDKFRDLDDVFLEIASKWDGLTQTQQRYIATTAAGSRQQSRFIAMMNNYKRTLELVDAAKNSEGASDVQFSKTLDSMESKLNQLHNAWDNFMMGITNNEFLKWTVDMGTTFVGTIDKIISGISKMTGPFEDFTRSFLSLGALGIGLKAGGKLVNTGLGIVGNLIDPSRKSSMFGGMTGRREAGNAQLASQINTPIVNVLNSILNVVSRGRNNPNNSKSTYGDYQKARQDVYKSLVGKDEIGNRKQFNLKDIQKNTKELDSRQTGVLYKSNPILGRATGRLFAQALNTPEVSKETQRALKTYALNIQKQMNTGELRTKEGSFLGTNRLKAAESLGGNYEKEIRAAVLKEAGKAVSSDVKRRIYKAWEKNGYSGDELRSKTEEGISKYYEARRSQQAQAENTTNLSRLESGALRVGNAANSAGQAVMGLGMAFNAAGFTTAGGMLTSIGSGIQGIGMAAQGAATLVSKFSNGILSFVKANPVVAGLGAAAAAIGLIYYSHQDYIKGIRKEGKKVEKDYERTTDRTTKNISKLQEYKSDFDKLSQGVDSNGYNIDLGTEEYKDYQKIVKDLIKINPSLVKGYNAQGQAIIDKNKAIEESIKVQEEEKKKAEDEYTSSESLDKLIQARNTKKRFDYKYQDKGEAGSRVGGATGAYGTMSQFTKDSESIIRNIRSLGDAGEDVLDELNKQYGVDFRELNEEGVRVLQQHGSEILDRVKQDTEGAVGVTDDKISNIQDSIATLGKHTEGFDKVVEPVYKALSTYISKQDIFKNIPEEFQSTLDASIKEIAGKKFTADGSELSGSEMQEMARNAANQIQDLKGHGDDYRKVLEEVDEAQKQFGQDLDVGEYEAKIDPLISKLQNWKKDFESSDSVVDQSIAEMLNNKIEELKNFTTESSTTLAEGFNTMSSNISSANKVLERYQEAQKKGDYYTASDNFKQVYEDISSEKNWAGEGSLSFEAGAMEMVGEENFFKLNTKELKRQVREVGSFFTEDASGINTFIDTVKGKLSSAKLDEAIFGKNKTVGDFIKVNEKGGLNFDKLENFDDTKMAGMASALGMSLDAFTAILNKARQFSNINFSNTGQLKQALATSESTITGLVNGEKKLYTRRSTFMQEAREAGVGKDEANDRMRELSKQGFVFMKDASQTTAKEISSYIKGWGIDQKNGAATTADFLRKFDQAQYNKEEIETLYETAAKKGLISDKESVNMGEEYSKLLSEKENPEMTVLNTIESEVSAISSKLDIRNGILTDEAKDKYKDVAFKNGEGRKRVWEEYDRKGKYDSSVNFQRSENAINQGIKETNNTIQELKAMEENATDDATKNSINKLITSATERKEEYELWKSRQRDKWEGFNKSAYEDTGIKLKGQDEKVARENGVDLRNAWNSSNIITSMGRLLDFARNNSISKEGKVDLAHQFYEEQKKNVTNIDDFQTFKEGLLKLAPKDNELLKALSGIEASLKKESEKSDSETKSSKGEGEKKGEENKSGEETRTGNKGESTTTNSPQQPLNYYSADSTAQGLLNSLKIALSTGTNGASTGMAWLNQNQQSLNSTNWTPELKDSLLSVAKGNTELTSKIMQLDSSIKNNTQETSKNTGSKKKETKKNDKNNRFNKPERTNNNNNNKNGRLNWKDIFGKGFSNTQRKGVQDPAKSGTSSKSSKYWNGIFTPSKGQIVGGTMMGGAIVGGVKTKTEGKGKADKVDKLKGRTVTIKVKISAKGVSEKIKSINKSVKNLTNKSKTIKIKVKNNTKEGLKGIRDSLKGLTGKSKKINITSNAKEVMSKITALLNKAKEINSTRPVLKIDSDFDDSAVNTARQLDNVTLATAYVKIKTKDETKDVKKNNDNDGGKPGGHSWTGTRNTLPVSPSLSFNSAANGLNNGTKKAKKGTRTTLTGEKGYEVAWLPSERRSTILGLKGPEIVDLPRDAVVYNHDQSKKIVKGNKNRPKLGSAAKGNNNKKEKIDIEIKSEKKTSKIFTPIGGNAKGDVNHINTGGGSGGGSNKDSGGNSGGDSGGGSDSGKSDKKSEETAKRNNESSKKWFKITTVWKTVTGKVSVWWDNISRRIDAAQRNFDKVIDKFSEKMNTVGVTAQQVLDSLSAAAKKAAIVLKENTAARNKASKELKTLDKGVRPLKKKSGKRNQKKLKEFQRLSKKKKKNKKQKNRFKKLKSWAANKGYINKKGKKKKLTKKGKSLLRRGTKMQTITYKRTGTEYSAKGKSKKKNKNAKYAKAYAKYQKTKSKKAKKKLVKRGYMTKKGKLTKKGKGAIKAKKITKDQKEKIDISKYIKRDKDTGQLQVDQKALNKVKDKNKKKAIKEKALEKIDESTQRKNDAEDKIKEIEDRFKSAGDEIYEKFYAWKASLEEIEVISQRIATLSERTAVADAAREKANLELQTGTSGDIAGQAQKMIDNVLIKFRNNVQIAEEASNKQDEIKKKIVNANSTSDERKVKDEAKTELKKDKKTTKKAKSNADKATKKAEKYDKKADKADSKKEKKAYKKKAKKARERAKKHNAKYTESIANQQVSQRKYDQAKSDLNVQRAINSLSGAKRNDEDGTYSYDINWDEFEKLQKSGKYSTEELSAIEEGLRNLEDLNTELLQATEEEINANIENLQLLLDAQQFMADTEQKIGEVLVARDQRVVDNLNKINDSIKNETSKLFDLIREDLDRRRQQDQNEKAKKSIADKQSRLAYLQNDSAGGHQVETLQLQKEIEEEQQSYRESLEDQLLANLQKSADEAAAQRERQISLMETQIEWNKQANVYAQKIDTWLNSPDKYKTEILSALTESNLDGKFKTKFTEGLAESQASADIATVKTDLAVIAESLTHIRDEANKSKNEGSQTLQTARSKGISNANTNELDAAIKDLEKKLSGNASSQEITAAQNRVIAAKGKVQADINAKDTADKAAADKAAADKAAAAVNNYNNTVLNAAKNGKIGKDEMLKVMSAASAAGKGPKDYLPSLAGRLGWEKVLNAAVAAGLDRYRILKTWPDSDKLKKAFTKLYGHDVYKSKTPASIYYFMAKSYKTGGLADYTGPAWLDGTKSKPEIVLNAQDTKNFLALKDTLSSFKNKDFAAQSNGDINFDIDINVEKIDNDYDVKKVADAVKKEIVKSASYRNVNIVRNLK